MLYFFLSILFFSTCKLHPESLKKLMIPRLTNIYDVNNIHDIEFIAQFPEYEDDKAYGQQPNYLDYNDLILLNPLVNWQNRRSYQIKNPKNLYVAKLQNAQVAPYLLGTIFHKDQQLLFSVLGSPHQPIFWPRSRQHKQFHKLATVQGPTLFYHSIIDRLPSVLLLRDTVLHDPNVKLLINNKGPFPNYLWQYLELLDIPRSQIVPTGSMKTCSAKELYFATPFLMEPIPRKLLIKLRNDLLQASKQKPLSREYKDNLIVIIQRRENNRRIKNINELKQTIQDIIPKNTFEIIEYKADVSVAEQIQIFNHARVVIGPMASGQTNIIYTKPGTTIIDIRPDFKNKPPVSVNNGGREWCWWLSSAFNLDYWPLPQPFNLLDTWINCPIEPIKYILKKTLSNQKEGF